MVQNNREESSPAVASPFIVQIIQAQGKTIQQQSKLNEELMVKTITILDRFINYDMQKIKQYDEFNRFLMEQKNIEKGILPPSQAQSTASAGTQEQQINNNPFLEILNKLNFLKTPGQEASVVNPSSAIPPAHVPSSPESYTIHPDFRSNKGNSDDYNTVQKQMKIMQDEIDRLKKGASSTDNDNAGNN